MTRRALSIRERACLQWAALGKSSREIGPLLGIRERTVNFHLQNACRKLSARNRRAAAVAAMAMGLLDLGPHGHGPRPAEDAAGRSLTGESAANGRRFPPRPAAACPPGRSPPPR
ncbi:helix-turn-helix domain-containing protein [Achromobacter aloeverae]